MNKKSKFGVNVGKKSKITIEWKDKPENYSFESKKHIQSITSERYGVNKENVRVNFIPTQYNEKGEIIDLSTNVINNIQDPKFQIKLFGDYIKENNITEIDFEYIKKIDSIINSKIDYDVYDKYRKYEIEWIEWSNFQSYGSNNSFDFRSLKGLTLIKGYPSNMSGKSSFSIDLISFLLFGKSQKPYTLSECFNKFSNDKQFKVRGCIKIDNGHYIIDRTVTRSQKKNGEWGDAKQTVKYFEIINGKEESLIDCIEQQSNETGEYSAKTNKIIKESIGSEKDFNMIISATSNDLDSLIDVGSTERGKLLSKWIGLFPLEEKDKIAKEHYKIFEKNLKSKFYDENDLINENKNLNDLIISNDKLINETSKRLNELDELIKFEQENKETLLLSKRKIDESVLKLDLTTINNKIEVLKEKGIKLKSELLIHNENYLLLKNIEFNDDDYKKLIYRDKEYSLKLNNIKNDIKNLKSTNKNLQESEFCPTCHRKYDGLDNSSVINENNKKIDDLIKKGIKINTELTLIKSDISKMDENKIEYNKKLKLENLIEILPIQIENLRNEYSEQIRLVKEYNENKEAIDLNNKIDIKLTNVNAKLNAFNIEKDNKNKDKINLIRNIEECNKSINKNNLIIEDINKELLEIKNWKVYLDMVGKNGISKMVLRKTLPIINAELSLMLDEVCDFEIEVVLNDKNEVIFNIIKDGVISNLAGASGFERTASALALRKVLGNISTMPRPNFITLDEVLGKVSSDYYDNIKNMYTKLENSYQFILHITHIEEIKDWHKNIIEIVKENNISTINAKINNIKN